MNIFANTVVTLKFELFDADNALLEDSREPIAYLHGGYSGMPPKLEDALNNHGPGDSVSVTLEPADAFGEYDSALIKIEPAARLPQDVAVGMMFEATLDEGERKGEPVVFTVTDVADGKVVLDGNHAWAGKRVRFECQIVDVRPARPEEIEHGHVHGPNGHQHGHGHDHHGHDHDDGHGHGHDHQGHGHGHRGHHDH